MKSMNPYLNFAGNCRDALNRYQQVFGGEIKGVQTYGDVHAPGSEAQPSK